MGHGDNCLIKIECLNQLIYPFHISGGNVLCKYTFSQLYFRCSYIVASMSQENINVGLKWSLRCGILTAVHGYFIDSESSIFSSLWSY